MFYRYEIRNSNGSDVLYLYLTMSYEFSRELGFNSSDKEIKRRTKNFIKNNGIDYNGSKVYLVIDGIVVKTLDIKDKEEIEELKEELFYSNNHYMINLKLDNNALIEITLKEYLLGVIATNMIPGLDIEALKVMAILYRTFAFKEMHENNMIDATNNLGVYKPISYYKLLWVSDYDDTLKMLSAAIDDTDCIFATYNNYYILPFIHISNNGKTKADNKYPYLEKVSSLWDLASPYYIEIKDFEYSVISKILNMNITNNSNIIIDKYDEDNLVQQIKIDSYITSSEVLINKLNLKSNDLVIILNKEYIRFITKGYGNNLGVSLFGANELALNGSDFGNILKYYLPNIKLNKYIKELS